MIIRKLAIIPAVLVALGLTIGTPIESFAQTGGKPAPTKKMKKKAGKKMKKKAAEVTQLRSVA